MHIVLTGANRGLGHAMTRLLVEGWHRVEATARNPDGATALGELCVAHPDRLRVHRLDVTDATRCRALAGALEGAAVGRSINNAGIDSGFIPFEQVDYAQALRIYDVDALGPLRMTHHLLAPLERAGGVVVNVSSRLGSITNSGALGDGVGP